MTRALNFGDAVPQITEDRFEAKPRSALRVVGVDSASLGRPAENSEFGGQPDTASILVGRLPRGLREAYFSDFHADVRAIVLVVWKQSLKFRGKIVIHDLVVDHLESVVGISGHAADLDDHYIYIESAVRSAILEAVIYYS